MIINYTNHLHAFNILLDVVNVLLCVCFILLPLHYSKYALKGVASSRLPRIHEMSLSQLEETQQKMAFQGSNAYFDLRDYTYSEVDLLDRVKEQAPHIKPSSIERSPHSIEGARTKHSQRNDPRLTSNVEADVAFPKYACERFPLVHEQLESLKQQHAATCLEVCLPTDKQVPLDIPDGPMVWPVGSNPMDASKYRKLHHRNMGQQYQWKPRWIYGK